MKNLICWIAVKILESKYAVYLTDAIYKARLKYLDGNVKYHEKLIKVKKGKIKYYLFFVETKSGVHRFNLGRHNIRDKIISGAI